MKRFRFEKPNTPQTLPESIPSTTSTTDPTRIRISTPSAFEGASSFTSQALRASQAAEISLERIQGSAELVDALSSLRKLVKPQGGTVGTSSHSLRLGNPATVLPRQLPDIQVLPAPFVLALLQEFKGRVSALMLAYAFRDHRQLEKLCQQVYFPTEPISMATLTLMNGLLFYLIKELLWYGDHGACKDYDLKAYYDQAERNFHLGVETYEIFTQPSLDSTRVLMIAVGRAVTPPTD